MLSLGFGIGLGLYFLQKVNNIFLQILTFLFFLIGGALLFLFIDFSIWDINVYRPVDPSYIALFITSLLSIVFIVIGGVSGFYIKNDKYLFGIFISGFLFLIPIPLHLYFYYLDITKLYYIDMWDFSFNMNITFVPSFAFFIILYISEKRNNTNIYKSLIYIKYLLSITVILLLFSNIVNFLHSSGYLIKNEEVETFPIPYQYTEEENAEFEKLLHEPLKEGQDPLEKLLGVPIQKNE